MIKFFAPFEITRIWDAEIVSQVNGNYVIRNIGWNSTIPANGASSFGFEAKGKVAPLTSSDFVVQDVATEAEPAALSVSSWRIAEGDAGARTANFTVSLSEASSETVTVRYGTANGTATAGSDYVGRSGTLTFAPGQTKKTVAVSVIGDKVFEADESFALKLSRSVNATIDKGTGTGRIVNDDAAPPKLSVSSWRIAEGDAGARAANFTVSLSEASSETVTVRYGTANGTALAGSDYVGRSGTLTFVPGQTKKTVAVSVIGDKVFEADESFALKLSAPTKATIYKGVGTGRIVNDDAPPPKLSVSSWRVAEGDVGKKAAIFTVSLSEASSETVTVRYGTANGTALAGSDYVGRSGTLTFAPGQTKKTVAVSVIGDRRFEADESFSLKLSAPSKATIEKGTGTGRIVNDDAAPPKFSVADVSVTEGTGGVKAAMVTVTLSAAATGAVAVDYATTSGTALARFDFTSGSGRLTFDAGEISKTFLIPIVTDARFEANETFKVTLSNPAGATIARGQATVTIVNDDAAPLPKLSVADVSLAEGNPIAAGSDRGFFRTDGNDIVDANGAPVKLSAVNWFGMESGRYAPDGLDVRNYKEMMDQMADLGFNAVRLPFSTQLFEKGSLPNTIDFGKNPDLKGLTGLQIMDKIIDYAGDIGIKIILDHHRSSAGAGPSANGLWFDATYSEKSWIDTWTMLADRYVGETAVVGADLHNEPHAGTWGGGGATDWAAAAERAGNAVLKANPDWLIIVEGVASYQNEHYWWGGNLMGVRDRPIELDLPNRVVYSPHDYPNSVYDQQPWFAGSDFGARLPAKFDQMWGFIERDGIAPVLIGEFGSKLTDPKDLVWLEKITAYLSGDYNADGVRDMPAGEQGANWAWWSWNPNSGDTGGILKDDWTTVDMAKVRPLQPLMFDLAAGGAVRDGVSVASFKVTLSAPSAATVKVDYATVAGTARASDFAAAAGTLTFAPGETTKTVAVKVRGDADFEADESFRFVLSQPRNAELADGDATGWIRNDDAPSASRMAMDSHDTLVADVDFGLGTTTDDHFAWG